VRIFFYFLSPTCANKHCHLLYTAAHDKAFWFPCNPVLWTVYWNYPASLHSLIPSRREILSEGSRKGSMISTLFLLSGSRMTGYLEEVWCAQ
jgi:hypothetical protein